MLVCVTYFLMYLTYLFMFDMLIDISVCLLIYDACHPDKVVYVLKLTALHRKIGIEPVIPSCCTNSQSRVLGTSTGKFRAIRRAAIKSAQTSGTTTARATRRRHKWRSQSLLRPAGSRRNTYNAGRAR